jgi:hypothetical protein
MHRITNHIYLEQRVMAQDSIDALQKLLISRDNKENAGYSTPCYITKRPRRISYTRDGIEYCFVEITCSDGIQYGIQAFGDEAIALYIEANRCFMCAQPSVGTKREGKIGQANEIILEGVYYGFDSSDCALIFKKLRSTYGNDFP